MSRRTNRTALVAFALFLAIPATALAADARHWTGTAGDHLWSNPANWDPPAVPDAGADLTFPAVPNTDIRVDVAGGVTVGSMNFNKPNGEYGHWRFSGNPIEVTKGIEAPSVPNTASFAAIGAHTPQRLSGNLQIGTLDVSGDGVTAALVGANNGSSIGGLLGSGTITITGAPVIHGGSFRGTVIGSVMLMGDLPDATIRGSALGNGRIARLEGGVYPGDIRYMSPYWPQAGTITADTVVLSRYDHSNGDVVIANRVMLAPTARLTLDYLDSTHISHGAPGHIGVILRNDGDDPIEGTFLDLPEGAIYVLNNPTQPNDVHRFAISYRGGDGNDVTLQFLGSTQTLLRNTPVTSVSGEPVTLTALIFPVEIYYRNRGTVRFLDGNRILGTATIAMRYTETGFPSDYATIETTFEEPGPHELRAELIRNESLWGSISTVVMHEVTKGNVSLDLRLADPFLELDVAAASPATGIPTGRIVITENATPIASAELTHGHAAIDLGSLAAGRHALHIAYDGDSRFEAATLDRALDLETRVGITGASVEEHDAGSAVALLTIALSHPHSDRVEVRWRTLDESAKAGSDYLLSAGIVTFDPGETSKPIDVTILGDTTPEETETLQVLLYDAVNAVIGNGSAEVRILTDDALYDTFPDLAHPAGLLTLRVPRTGTPPYPLVVAIEAASWSFVTRHAMGAEWLAKRGYAVATIEFTPSTIAVWPRQLDDVRIAVAWLREHAGAYDLDREHLGVLGIRAGGQLAAHLGLRGDVQAVVAWDGPVDFSQLDGCGTLASDVATLLGCAPDVCVERVKTACPTASAVSTPVPFLVLHHPDDCEVPIAQAFAFASTLRTFGATVHVEVGDEPAARDATTRFFDTHLRAISIKRRAAR